MGSDDLGAVTSTGSPAAIAHVVRCFEDTDIAHVSGNVDPLRDIGVINTELVLADLEQVQRALEKAEKQAKTGKKDDIARRDALARMNAHLDAEGPARTFAFGNDDPELFREFNLLTAKPIMYVANVDESGLADSNEFVSAVNAADEDKTLEAPPEAFVTAEFLNNFARVTKPGGLAVVTVQCSSQVYAMCILCMDVYGYIHIRSTSCAPPRK